MNGRTAKRLRDLEIDEVSLVDRPANQHGLVAFSKRDEGQRMSLIDEQGFEVDESELEFGETVTDSETGEQFYVATEDEAAQLGVDYEDDGELVGKATTGPAGLGPRGRKAWDASRRAKNYGKDAVGATGDYARMQRQTARNRGNGSVARGAASMGADTARRVSRNRGAQIGAGAGAAGFAGGYGSRRNVNKSLGESIYEELSKSYDQADRDEVISKVAEMVDEANANAAEAYEFAKALQEERDLAAYTDLAGQYDHLPVPAEQLGLVLKNAAAVLPPAQLAILDRALSAQPMSYDELGFNGGLQSDVMGQIAAMTQDAISKGVTDLSQAEVTVGLLEANPALYDEYLAETGH